MMQASGTSPFSSTAAVMPSESNIGTTLGPSWMPYPMAPNSGACSRMRTGRPARPSASAVVSPPRPPPTMRIGWSAPRMLSLRRHADPLDLPIEIDTGDVAHARAHGLAECLDVGRAGAALVDQEVAMQLRHLGGTDRQATAAGGVDELPRLAAGR